MSKIENGESAFKQMCKTGIILIIIIILLGITAIVMNICVGKNPNWSIPVKVEEWKDE